MAAERAAKTIIRTTCPRDCYDACGIAVIKRGEAITKVVGDPDHAVSRGALCGKCALAYNGAWRDASQRLGHPLKRIGPKGEGRFQPVSWERGDDGDRRAPDAHRRDQRSSLASFTRITPAPVRRSPAISPCASSTAWAPARSSRTRSAISPATSPSISSSAVPIPASIRATAKDAACILVWGANPSASAPHAHKHWLPESPAKKIVIDPVRHPTAAAADLHLQPFPGSDAALAFAMLHVIRRDGLLDRDYLAKNTIGWDEVEAKLDACTPAWGEKVTGVPAALIEQAARLYGQGPVAAVAGPGPAAPAHGRQCLSRLRAAAGGDRQYRQARRRVLLPQWRAPRHRRRLSRRRRAAQGAATAA